MYIKSNSSMVVELLAIDEDTVKMTLRFGSKSSITKKQEQYSNGIGLLLFQCSVLRNLSIRTTFLINTKNLLEKSYFLD